MEHPKFQVFKSIINQLYYFRFKTGNGEIILGNKGYESRDAYLAAISSVKSSASNDKCYERKHEESYTFNLRADNGEIIAQSEKFNTLHRREKVIELLKTGASEAPVEELI